MGSIPLASLWGYLIRIWIMKLVQLSLSVYLKRGSSLVHYLSISWYRWPIVSNLFAQNQAIEAGFQTSMLLRYILSTCPWGSSFPCLGLELTVRTDRSNPSLHKPRVFPSKIERLVPITHLASAHGFEDLQIQYLSEVDVLSRFSTSELGSVWASNLITTIRPLNSYVA